MKKLLMSAALLTVLASPAFAQSYNPGYGTGNPMPTPPSWQAQNNGVAASADRGAFAYAPRGLRGVRAEAAQSEPDVYAYGHDVGTDPDPNIRFQLRRDPPGLD